MKTVLLCILTLTLIAPRLSHANQSQGAFAIPISSVFIDGNLDDWPKDLEPYPIQEISSSYTPSPPDGPEDFSAYFQAGYNSAANLLYLAIVVQDEELVTHPEAPAFHNQDLCEIYIDADHSGGDRSGRLLYENEGNTKGAQQYMMVAGPGLAFSEVKSNPALVAGDTEKSGVRAAFSREGTTTVYEWAIPLFISFPDQPFQAEAGKTIGFDVAVTDADGDENGNWVSWTPGAGKVFNSALMGNLILIKSYAKLGVLAGTLTSEAQPLADMDLDLCQSDQTIATTRTDAAGRFHLRLAPGDYALELKGGQGFAPTQAAGLAVFAGQETRADLVAKPMEVPEILKQSAAAYQALRTYADTTVTEMHMVGPSMDNRNTLSMPFAYARPNRIRLEISPQMGGSLLVSDGLMLVNYLAMIQQYTNRKAPEVLALADLQGPGMGGPGGIALFHSLLLSQEPLKELMKGLEGATELGREQLGAVPVIVVEMVKPLRALGSPPPPGMEGVSIPVRLWIGTQDHLIRQVSYELDMGQMAAQLPAAQRAMMEGMKMGLVERHRAIQLDQDLPAATFAFVLPAEAKLVEQFGSPANIDKADFVGKPAPAFALKNLEGAEVTLANFEGKVLIVDFWATWCGPCKAELPTFTALQSQYAKQGFSVIGLSTDDQAQTVRNFAQQHQVNFPLLMADNKVRQDYGNISAIPTTFVIDKQGVVRYVHVGTPEDMLIFQQEVEELVRE